MAVIVIVVVINVYIVIGFFLVRFLSTFLLVFFIVIVISKRCGFSWASLILSSMISLVSRVAFYIQYSMFN